MRFLASITFVALTLVGSSALAQTPDAGRRRIYPTQDGFLEVDPRSGAITECKRSQGGYQCTPVSDGDPLLKEDSGPRAQAPAPPTPPPTASPRQVLPSEEEIDRALDVMERFLRRFMGIVREGRPERT
jgi:hypothetical protein